MTHGTPEIHPKWQTRVIQDSLNKQSITNSIEGVSRALLLVLCTLFLRLLRLLRLILNHSRNAASLRLLVKLPRAAKSATLVFPVREVTGAWIFSALQAHLVDPSPRPVDNTEVVLPNAITLLFPSIPFQSSTSQFIP